jgi:hypothetical protein
LQQYEYISIKRVIAYIKRLSSSNFKTMIGSFLLFSWRFTQFSSVFSYHIAIALSRVSVMQSRVLSVACLNLFANGTGWHVHYSMNSYRLTQYNPRCSCRYAVGQIYTYGTKLCSVGAAAEIRSPPFPRKCYSAAQTNN